MESKDNSLKLLKVISPILMVGLALIYFYGPRTHYTGLIKLIYNSAYIFSTCPGESAIISGDDFNLSYLVYTDTGVSQETDKDKGTRVWIPNGPVIRIYTSLPENYKNILRSIPGSERIPAKIKSTITREGMSLETAPWIIAEDIAPYYAKTSMLIAESVRVVALRNGNKAVSFITRGDPMAGGGYLQHIFFMGPKGQFCEISSAAPDPGYDPSLLDIWRSRSSGAPVKFPSASADKHLNCQLQKVSNSLEFI